MSSKDKITTFRKLNKGTIILLQTNFHTKENIKVLGEVLSKTTEPYEGQYFVKIQYIKDTILTETIFEITDLWTIKIRKNQSTEPTPRVNKYQVMLHERIAKQQYETQWNQHSLYTNTVEDEGDKIINVKLIDEKIHIDVFFSVEISL